MRKLKGLVGAMLGTALVFLVANIIENGAHHGVGSLLVVGGFYGLFPYAAIALTDRAGSTLRGNILAGIAGSMGIFILIGLISMMVRQTFFMGAPSALEMIAAFGTAGALGVGAAVVYRLFAGPNVVAN